MFLSKKQQHPQSAEQNSSIMKALVLHGPGDLRLDEVPKPTASPGSVVVRVIAAPLWDYVVRFIAPIPQTFATLV